MSQRVKGQEVSLDVVADGVVLSTLTDIRNFELTPKFTKLEEQYLGETTKRYDELFDGVDFKMDLHFENDGVLQFVETVKARAIRQTPNTVINIRASLQFSNGTRTRVVLENCFFENLPIEFGGREQYGQFTISGSCSDFSRV